MKILPILLLALSPLAFAERVRLGEFDQAHLGNLMYSLPESIVEKKSEWISSPDGERVTLKFAPAEEGLVIRCRQEYYGRSPWASFSGCTVDVDLKSPAVVKQNDEVRITVTDPLVSSALYEVIPYGRPQKRFYSFDRFEGITFEGDFDNLFTYRFTCSPEQCLVDLAVVNLMSETKD